MPIIEIEKVCKFFGSGENRVQVLHDVSFTVEDGDFVAIIGQSGSGKSTLMNLIGCLDMPSSGVCRIDGVDVAALDADSQADLRGTRLGFIFQRYNLLSKLTALENTALPAVYTGLEKRDRQERAKMLLEELGLADKLKNLPTELSGGQQQRVSIARALMNGGRIILADEPTGALDSASGENVMGILTDLNKRGHTIILVTHDAAVAAYAGRRIRISDGRIVEDERNRPFTPPSAEQGRLDVHRSSWFAKRLDRFKEALRMSLQAIWAHKMRSLLTMLGIIIGIASVASVVALGRGSQEKIIADINSMGTNTIDIYPGTGFGDRHSGRVKTLVVADAEILAKQPYIISSTPNTSASGTLVYRNISVTAQLSGVGASYFDVKGLEPASGRFFNDEEVRGSMSYVVIDDNTREKLFPGGETAEGEMIIFNRQPLRIIGVAKKKDVGFGPSDTLTLWSPYSTVMNRITGERNISSITVKLHDNVVPALADSAIKALITARHGKTDFFTRSTDSIKQTVESATNTMTLLIAGIALISLVVGGIGVMNIMLVSVTERTREIGVRMAVGARQINIMEQFLLEATLLCLTGGFLGIALALFIGVAVKTLAPSFSLAHSPDVMVLAMICSSVIGVIFGFIPARNAAKLNPIEALSRE
ncbi:MAG: Macrolide export ATP-binding/permease protein MacB [Desulfovibrio sp.]